MSKLRSVSTQFWSDPWIEDLTANEKLLYLYFITNEKTNMLGVYELSIKKISFETGLNKDVIEKALKGFETIGKVKYIQNYVILLNFTKHQNYNTNMKISAIDVYNNLPNSLKANNEVISKANPLEGFERVCNRLGMVRKVEDEVETEDEVEDEILPTKSDVCIDDKTAIYKERIKDFDNECERMLAFYNKTFGKQCRVVNAAVKAKLKNTLKDYDWRDIGRAMLQVKEDKHHIESGYKWATLEFFTRPVKIDAFAFTSQLKPEYKGEDAGLIANVMKQVKGQPQ
jgi:hypothetical protein